MANHSVNVSNYNKKKSKLVMEALPILVSLYFLISNHSPCPTWQCILKTNKTNWSSSYTIWASQVALVIKNPPANAGDFKRWGFSPWVGKIPWWREWQPTLVFLSEKSHGQRSLVGYSSWVAESWTWLKWLSSHSSSSSCWLLAPGRSLSFISCGCGFY